MTLKTSIIALFVAVATCASASAQVSYSVFNNAQFAPDGLLLDRNGDPIEHGNETAAGNLQGMRVQIGYFSGQTIGNFSTVFEGEFEVLLDFFSGDSANGTTEIPDGQIGLDFTFNIAPPTEGVKFATGSQAETVPVSGYPAAGTYLALRWYDSADTSGFYNTIAQSTFTWVTPAPLAPPGTTLDLFTPYFAGGSTANIALESGESPDNGLFASIPEPGFSGLAFAALGLMAFMRRRKA